MAPSFSVAGARLLTPPGQPLDDLPPPARWGYVSPRRSSPQGIHFACRFLLREPLTRDKHDHGRPSTGTCHGGEAEAAWTLADGHGRRTGRMPWTRNSAACLRSRASRRASSWTGRAGRSSRPAATCLRCGRPSHGMPRRRCHFPTRHPPQRRASPRASTTLPP